MALDMLYEAEVLGRSVSAVDRRTDLFKLVRAARHRRDLAIAEAASSALGKATAAVGKALMKLAYAVEGWRKRRATFGELMSLDDRLLSDIGIQRADIPAIAEAASTRRFDGESRMVFSGSSYTRAI
jgi:uncharacterized protein YjiS (DUF1127 family)